MAEMILKVTPKELRNKSSEFKAKANQVKGCTDYMLNLVNQINGSTWSGDAANSYKTQFSKLSGDMQDMYKMIEDYSKHLTEIAAKYETTEKSNQVIAQQLATDVIN